MTANLIDRRRLLALLAVPAVAHLLASCSSESKRGGGGSTASEARSDLRRVDVPVADAEAAAAAINAFTADLYGALVADQPTANVVFSPASVAIAMMMATAGASGATAEQIYRTFHVDDPSTIDRSMNALSAHLDSIDRTEGSGDAKREVQLNIANSMWAQNDLRFESAYLDLLAQQYGAPMNLVDYKNDGNDAVQQINRWVDERTKQRIPRLLSDDDVTVDTRFVLVNAVYLLATWTSRFKKEGTRKEPFTTAAGTEVNVDMMRQELFCGYSKGPGWQAVELPYSFDRLAFTAVLPDADTVDAFSPASIAAEMSEQRVDLGLPKFDFETAVQLGDVLQRLGIKQAFDPAADFSAMTKDERLRIAKVIHQANITVDERGTEAAAATAVIGETTSAPAPSDPIELTFDRPFTFWIRDLTTGAVVFAGRVTDPSQTR